MDPRSAAALESESAFGIELSSPVTVLAPAGEAALADITADTPDLELCRRAADGDLEAFEMVYQKYHRRTYSLCLRMTASQTEAEDLTQERSEEHTSELQSH